MFQTFVQSNIPPQFGAEINLGQGSAPGTVQFSLVGGWYGPKNQLAGVLSPLLARLPKNPQVTLVPGTYLNSVTFLAGGSLNTTKPDISDTFYAKSLTTPQNSPMLTRAMNAFINYLANEGQSSIMVSFDSYFRSFLRLRRMAKTLVIQNWFVQVELYGGANSAINKVAANATAFSQRTSIFNIQFYASSSNSAPPFPDSGFSFVDGESKVKIVLVQRQI